MTTPRANLRTVKIVFDAAESDDESAARTSGAAAASEAAEAKNSPLLFSGTFLFAIGGFDGKNFLKSMEVLGGGSSQEWQTYINFNKPLST